MAAIKIKVGMMEIWHNRSQHGWSLIETSIFYGEHTAYSAATIIPRTGPVSFAALGIVSVAGQCPCISSHIKTAIGISARRRQALSSSHMWKQREENNACVPNLSVFFPHHKILGFVSISY